jgi:hypothetical protein
MADNKQYKVEWSFDFDKVADRIKDSVEGLVGEVEVKTAHYETPIENTTAASVELYLSVGSHTIQALGESQNIIEADLTYVGEVEYTVTGEAIKQIKLAQKGSFNNIGESIKNTVGFAVKGTKDLKWTVGLTKDLPLELKLDGGVGPSVVDLTDINLRGLSTHAGVGEMTLTLPSTTDVYSVTLEGGVGRTFVTILKGAMVNLTIQGGVGGTYVTVQDDAHVNLKIKGGVGETKVETPATAGVSLNGTTGLGNISVPAHLVRVSNEDSFLSHSGSWETANYTSAENKITIEYEGGIGQLIVR